MWCDADTWRCTSVIASTKLPLLSIAGRFNRKDHTTVKHACGSIRRQIEQDRGVQSDYEEILEKIVA